MPSTLTLRDSADSVQRVPAPGLARCRPDGPRAYCVAGMATLAERDDETLMLDYRAGDVAAFDELYRRHKGGLYRYLLRQSRDAAAAAEMFQDTWMNLVRARANYQPTAKFTTYLYRLAHNRLVDHYRRQAHGASVPLAEDAMEEPALNRHEQPEVRYERKALAARVLELLERLPAEQREAFVLQQESDLTVEEIAAVTGVNRETAKSRLRYALAKLRAGLSEWR
ncbi:MAG: RNA polymerase sigma factor [Betaproteobacteria bacterium]